MQDKWLIRGNRIFDAESKQFFPGTILIKDGKILAVERENGGASASSNAEYERIEAGNCVIAPGFIDIHSHEDLFDETSACQVAEDMVRMGVTTCVAGNCGTMFQPLEQFLAHVDTYGTPTNYIFFSGYNAQRKAAGVDLYGSCPAEKMDRIAAGIKQDLERGAMGLSFGLEYAPGINIDEIETILSLIGRKDLKISIHIRDDKEASIPAVEEAIEISRRTELPVFLSHIGSMSAYGQIRRVYELIEKANCQGLKIHVDCYPYNAFATRIGSAVFDEASMAKGKFTYDQIKFATGPFAGQYCNETLYKEARNKHPESFAIGFGMKDEELCYAFARPETMISSDGFVLGNQGHPRTAGSFPRVLRKYVREEGILSLEEALCKMTIQPAAAAGLKHKGIIAPGKDADLVLFDPQTIADRADFSHVNEPPKGIELVMVNGKAAVRGSRIMGRYGKFIPMALF